MLAEFFKRLVTLPSVNKSTSNVKLEQCPTNWAYGHFKLLRGGILIEAKINSQRIGGDTLLILYLSFTFYIGLDDDGKESTRDWFRIMKHSQSISTFRILPSLLAHQTLNTAEGKNINATHEQTANERKRYENFHISFMRCCDHQTINQPALLHNSKQEKSLELFKRFSFPTLINLS